MQIVMARVMGSVQERTQGRQSPELQGNLYAEIFLADSQSPQKTEESKLWQGILQNPDAEGFAFYLKRYPGGLFSGQARQRLEGLTKGLPRTEQRSAMLVIPAGTFTMGSPASEEGRSSIEDEHEMRISRGYWLGQTEVTQGQWERVMGTNPSAHKGTDLPVEGVTWFDALKYCNRLSQAEGLAECYQIEGENVRWLGGLSCAGYRLPTEAEWEYAARAGQQTVFAGSNKVDDVAWYHGDSASKSHPVGKKTPNRWGLHDMSGNVSEWVWDLWGVYGGGAETDPVGPDSGPVRVERGGSWAHPAQRVRVAYRGQGAPGNGYSMTGFRLTRSLP